jgi:hypothetical protein
MVRRRLLFALFVVVSQLGLGCCHRHCMRVQCRIEHRMERRNACCSPCAAPAPCDCAPGMAHYMGATATVPPNIIPVPPTPVGAPMGAPMKMPVSPTANPVLISDGGR